MTTAGEGGVSSGFVGSGHTLAGTDLQYRALFHSMDQGFCVIEVRFDDASTAVDYRFLEVNAAFEQQTGLRDAQDRWMRELAPNHEDHWFHIYGQVALTGQPVRFENAANALGARWFDVYAFRVGEPSLRRVAILFRDITQRKNTERALRRREAQLQTLFDAAPLGIYVVDDEFRIRAVNPAALPVFAEIADPVGRVLDEVSHALWTREQAPDVVAQFRRTLETGEPYVVAEHRDGSGESSEPTYYEWEIHRIPLPESRFGVVCYFRNITHQVLARQTLSEADRRKNEFIATLSHELRNPLASIHSAAELLHQPNAHEATREWAAAVAQRQTKAMARLLDDLLDVSRLTLGRLEMRKERVALSSVLDSALETARPAIERANHTVSITKPPASILVDADPLRLSQVFSNLLSNAAKYTAPGGRIALAVEVQPDEVIISVSDNGIGIAPADIGSVFEMFMQTPDARSRSSEGLGIGLALVRGIVELHDGHVIAESEGVGSGSRFTVFLPRALSDGKAVEPADAESSATRNQRYRVLIADDNVDAAQALGMLLELYGHETRVVTSGHAALREAEAFRPHAAVLDIGMPDLDGYAVAQRIRQAPWGKRISLFAATGWGQEKDKRMAEQAGFDAHLTKPLDAAKLQSLIVAEIERFASG